LTPIQKPSCKQVDSLQQIHAQIFKPTEGMAAAATAASVAGCMLVLLQRQQSYNKYSSIVLESEHLLHR